MVSPEERAAAEAAAAVAAGDAPPAVTLEQLREAGQELLGLNVDIELLEEELKDLKAKRTAVARGTLPDMMQSAGMGFGDNFEVEGEKLTLRRVLDGSFPTGARSGPEKVDDALDKLEEYGALSLVTVQVVVGFPKGNYDEAWDLRETIAGLIPDELKQNVSVELKQTVHHATLKSFGQERLERGEPLDCETLGLFLASEVKVQTKRKPKA